jgi:hypothetical protein
LTILGGGQAKCTEVKQKREIIECQIGVTQERMEYGDNDCIKKY